MACTRQWHLMFIIIINKVWKTGNLKFPNFLSEIDGFCVFTNHSGSQEKEYKCHPFKKRKRMTGYTVHILITEVKKRGVCPEYSVSLRFPQESSTILWQEEKLIIFSLSSLKLDSMTFLCWSITSLSAITILMKIMATFGASSFTHQEDVTFGELRPTASSWLPPATSFWVTCSCSVTEATSPGLLHETETSQTR